MKRIPLSTLPLLFITLSACAQDVDKLISQNEVARVIKTLSADDMEGRGTFTPGIDKAATFIEGEFKSAGLTPLAGESGFRQRFDVVRYTADLAVTVDGKAVPAENIACILRESDGAGGEPLKENIAAGENLMRKGQSVFRSETGAIVTVDGSLKKDFQRIMEAGANGTVIFPDGKEKQFARYVFLLGVPKDAKIEIKASPEKQQKQELFNVAGMIPGKSKKEEYVVFSGHYDHLGIIKPVGQDSIANGADDDASGTTAVIELAKYYKKLNSNARTLVFVAFTAEEIGGYGSQYFSRKLNPDQVTAMFNIEMIGKASKFGKNAAFITGYERSDFGTILQKNLKGTKFTFHPDPYPEQNLFYRSDNATLARFGVPAHTISTDQIDKDELYHTVKDEFSSLDVSNITSTIRAIALSSRSIVSGMDTPKRIEKSTVN
ncbi:MAG: M20/M25/M40 family metallo-hydrolase [Mucilaginibacter polytrichastri]|nr:M20/M25/M40 family metallo-hydrolase [Mucilaginibacter polytrichastri]